MREAKLLDLNSIENIIISAKKSLKEESIDHC